MTTDESAVDMPLIIDPGEVPDGLLAHIQTALGG